MSYWKSPKVTKNQWKYEETYYINQTTNQKQTQRHHKRKETLDENLKVKDLENECTRLYATLTDEQALKVQEIVDETFGNLTFDTNQIFEVLKIFQKILIEVKTDCKPNYTEEDIVYLPSFIQLTTVPAKKNSSSIIPTTKACLPESDYEAVDKILDAYYISEDPKENDEINLEAMIDDYLNILDTWIAESKTVEVDTTKDNLETPEQYSKKMDDSLNQQIKPKEFCDQNGKTLDEAIENWNRKVNEFKRTIKNDQEKIINPCPIESIEPQSVDIDPVLDSYYQNKTSFEEKEPKALPYHQKSDEVDKLSDDEMSGWYSVQDTASSFSGKLLEHFQEISNIYTQFNLTQYWIKTQTFDPGGFYEQNRKRCSDAENHKLESLQHHVLFPIPSF